MYEVNVADGQARLTPLQTIHLEVEPWDVTFDDGNQTLWVLSPVEGATLAAFRLRGDRGSEESSEALQVLVI